MPDPILQVLSDLFYNDRNSVGCGPDRASTAYFQNASYKVGVTGDSERSLPILVPDNMYKPELYFVVDFAHQFTISETNPKGETLKGERPVSEATLEKVSFELLKFFQYYFTYGSSTQGGNNAFQNALDATKIMENEENRVLFVNHILNFFVMSYGIDRAVGQVGTATIGLKDMDSLDIRGQGHGFRLFYDKTMGILNQLLAPMLPVAIWARGRYYKDWFFPQFDGYITNVAYTDAQGFTGATINCRDQLELARVSHEMVNPAIITIAEHRSQPNINIFEKPFYNIDHFQIVGGMFKGGEIKYDPENGGRILEIDTTGKNSKQTQTTKSSYQNFQGLGNFEIAVGVDNPGEDKKLLGYNISKVVQQRGVNVKDIGSNFLQYFLTKVSHNRPRAVVGWGVEITPYRIWNTQSVPTFTSQFDSRLSIVQKVAEMTYYNLYADALGNIQYHPMRLSNRYLDDICMIAKSISDPEYIKNPFPGTQVITPHERLNANANLSIEELCTFMHLEGVDTFVPGDTYAKLTLQGSATDKELLKRYGYRRRDAQNPLFNISKEITDRNTGKPVKFMDAAAYALMKFSNAELYTRQESVAFRPELDLAQPIYIADTDEVFYAQSLSVSVTLGGDASSGINMNLGRKYNDAPVDLMSFIEDTEKFYKNKTGQTSTLPDYEYYAKQTQAAMDSHKADEERAKKALDIGTLENLLDTADDAAILDGTQASKEESARSSAVADAQRKL